MATQEDQTSQSTQSRPTQISTTAPPPTQYLPDDLTISNDLSTSRQLFGETVFAPVRQDTIGSTDSRRLSHPVPRRPPEQELRGENEPWKHKNVLSLDGGGIRGYYSLLFLQYLMTVIRTQEQTFTDGTGIETPAESSFHPCIQPLNVSHSAITMDSNREILRRDFLPCHYFDYICGTSTGGLIAIMLSRLRMSVDDCIEEYLTLGGEIFGKPRHFHQLQKPLLWWNRTKYDAEVFKKVIQDVTGRRGRRGDESNRFASEPGLCSTFAFAYKKSPNQNEEMAVETPYIFRSYDHFRRGRGGPRTQNLLHPRNPGEATTREIWEVARATTAAPFYFDPLIIMDIYVTMFIDGGFGGPNNPAEEAYEEVTTSNEAIGTFVSVGTGRKTTDRFKKGFANKIGAAVDALGDPETAHHTVLAKSVEEGKQFSYFRFNEPNALPDTDFDEWKPRSGRRSGMHTLEKMKRAFQVWALKPDVQDDFQRCARELVRRRRLRTAETSRWERYALGASFNCETMHDCAEPVTKRWYDRRKYTAHLLAAHRDAIQNSRATIDDIIDKECRSIWAYKAPRNGHNNNHT